MYTGRMTRYFGTDGIRGTVGQAPVTADFALHLGHALGLTLKANGLPPLVVIGKDTRLSGYMFESALEAGLASAGTDIRLLGPMPTPAIAYLTRTLRAGAGIVISASHNPYHDNGFKFFSGSGEKLSDDFQAELESRLEEPLVHCEPADIGRAERVADAAGRYIEHCKRSVPASLTLAGLHVVVDCAHGATYQIAPRVLDELGAQVTAIGNQPDGMNINRGFGSTHPQQLIETVRKTGADLGMALDGDGDRVLLVDDQGELLNGDQMLYIMARQRQRDDRLKGGVVGTLMSNFGFEVALGNLGIPFARAAVGDRHVHRMLIDQGWQLGGEASGHVICLDKTTTGDGMVSALEVFQVVQESGLGLHELKQGMQLYPQIILNVPVTAPYQGPTDHTVEVIEACTASLAGQGRIVFRPSGTEPVVRVTVEGRDHHTITQLAERIATAVNNENAA